MHNSRLNAPPFLALWIVLISGSGVRADEKTELREVQSIAAEVAEILRLKAADRVYVIYVDTMLANARAQLRDLDGTVKAGTHAAISEALTGIDSNDADRLRRLANRIFKTAGPRGPAD